MDNEIVLFDGWRMPATERSMNAWMSDVMDRWNGRIAYQGHKIRRAIDICKTLGRDGVALDIGAHIGTWSYYLAHHFKKVVAWEPIALHARCFRMNVTASNVDLHECALGEEEGEVLMHMNESSTGDSRVVSKMDGGRSCSVKVKRLDSFDASIGGPVALVKIDCEGYEYFVLRGGESILLRDKPVIVVEQKPGKGSFYGLKDDSAVTYLESLGAVKLDCISGDYFLIWK